jgi:hypothetical protein
MKLAALALTSLFAGACVTDDEAGGDKDFDAKTFVGAYRNTLTLSGTGSQTLTDSVTVAEGSTSDLILTSQTLGAMKAKVIGKTSFSLEQQQITISVDGQAVSVNVMGQGTISDGVFNSTGTLSNTNGALSFTWAGARL